MLKKNLVYVVVFTVVITALFSLNLFEIWPTTLVWTIVRIAICTLLGGFMAVRMDGMLGSDFGFGKIFLICIGWILHCVLYANVVFIAVKIISKIFS